MKNLAGREDCDSWIQEELRVAGIPTAVQKGEGEVPYTLIGKLGQWTFKRAWYYYVAEGGVLPLSAAQELYADPAGKRDIRAGGDCGCPPPEHRAHPINEKGDLGIRIYHVDSELGLRLLADKIKEAEKVAAKRLGGTCGKCRYYGVGLGATGVCLAPVPWWVEDNSRVGADHNVEDCDLHRPSPFQWVISPRGVT